MKTTRRRISAALLTISCMGFAPARAQDAGAEPFDEIWHMVKPRDGSRGWTLAGIAQVQ